MRKNLRNTCLALGTILLTTSMQAQDRYAFAVTDVNPASAGWSVLRKINIQNGEFSDVLLNGIEVQKSIYSASTKKQIEINANTQNGNLMQLPFSTGVAAIAFDKRHNRLYYTPMFIDQLRYVDLNTMQVFYVNDQSFTGLGDLHNDESKIVTRMVINENGEGYAITNDATSFIRFSTGKKTKIEQLGALVDDPSNTGISIHNRCSSWGGDMIADDEGNLYVFSAHNNVFKINTGTKVATWLGPVTGLPQSFSINGAIVTDDGNLLVGSQGYASSWYLINPKDWKASAYTPSKGVYLTSDLANSNVLATRKSLIPETVVALKDAPITDKIQLYPNPVSSNQFNIQFAVAGDFIVDLTDIAGRQVMQKKVNISGEGQIHTINLNKNFTKGIYLVKVTNFSTKALFTQKLVVQ